MFDCLCSFHVGVSADVKTNNGGLERGIGKPGSWKNLGFQ